MPDNVTKVYAVRKKGTTFLNPKYGSSNPFYLRLNDARAAKNALNGIYAVDDNTYETVVAELDWKEI